MTDFNQTSDEIQLAMFNLAMPYLQRINGLLDEISIHYRDGEMNKYAWTIRSLYREIAPKLSEEERKEWTTAFWKAMSMVKENHAKHIIMLEHLELRLRDHLEKRGMLVPSASDRRFMKGVQ